MFQNPYSEQCQQINLLIFRLFRHFISNFQEFYTYQQLTPDHTDLKKSSGIERIYLIISSEKPGPMDTKSNEQMFHLGYKPSNESIERINTPEALSYFGKLKEKYNREEIPNFWDSRLGGN